MATSDSGEPPPSSNANEQGKKMKTVSLLGLELKVSETKARRALVGASIFLVTLNGVGLPFVLPKLKHFLGAPYVPMKRKVVEALFDDVLPSWAGKVKAPTSSPATASGMGTARSSSSTASSSSSSSSSSGTSVAGSRPSNPLAGLKLVDFGSGDGRIVRAAGARGLRAVGYEMNPYLVFWSRFRSLFSPVASEGEARFRWCNAWSADFRSADVVTIYGRPGDGLMERVADKCMRELPDHAAVVSHYFPLPGLGPLLVVDKHGLMLYDMSRRARLPPRSS